MRRFSLVLAIFLACGITAAQAMQISILTPSHQSITLDVEPSDTIENVKTKIQDKISIEPENQHILWAGQYLADGTTLSDNNVNPSNTLTLVTDRFGKCTYIGDPCAYGDVGPGGGRVFITPDTDVNSTGQYFEAQPESTDSMNFCRSTDLVMPDASAIDIGTGASNTALFAASGCETGSAISYVENFSSNGFKDWFIPSLTETAELDIRQDVLNLGSSPLFHGSSYTELFGQPQQQSTALDFHSPGGYTQTGFPLPVIAVRMFSLIPAPVPEYPVPPQSDSIYFKSLTPPGESVTVTVGGTLTVNGAFSLSIRNIYVDSIQLKPSEWVQTPNSLTITLPPHKFGVAQIQIFNGAAPVLPAFAVRYVDSNEVLPALIDSRPISSCTSPKRTYTPRARTCLPGYTALRR